MAKRANGEGNIHKRKDGRFQVSFPTGIYKDNGKREIIYRYAATQAEASEILLKLRSENGIGVHQSSMTTGDWVDVWIEKYKAPKLKPATLTSYRGNARVHIKPAIGKIPLRDLKTAQIQRALNNIGGSYSTFVKNYNVIHGALEKAVELGMIARNPCKGVYFPEDDKKEMRVLSKEEQEKFITVLEGEYYRPMFLTYLYTGMRMGEAIPLTWEDVNLAEREIRVNKKAIICHNFEKHEAKTEIQNFCKTKSSKRSITITTGLARVLSDHKERMKAQAVELGQEWSESGLVFPNTAGRIVNARNLQNVLYRIYAKAGIEGATMHTLRHTYATRCFEADIKAKMISKQLGHAKVKTTLDVYVHVLPETKRTEVDKLAEMDKLLA